MGKQAAAVVVSVDATAVVLAAALPSVSIMVNNGHACTDVPFR